MLKQKNGSLIMLRKDMFSGNQLDFSKVGLPCLLLMAGFLLLLVLSMKTVLASTTSATTSVYLPLITKAVPQPRLAEPQVYYEEECGGNPEITVASPLTLESNPELLGFRATIYNAAGKTIATEYLWNGEIGMSNSYTLPLENPIVVSSGAWGPQPTWGPSCDWTVPNGEYEARFYVDGVLLGTANATVDGEHSNVHP